MKLVPDLDPEKKVIPWDRKLCILMRMSLLKKNIGSISAHLCRGGLRRGKTGRYPSRELPGDLTMTELLYCCVDLAFE